MGEVWRATDTKLNRDVAIKILPEAFAQDADRMARFEREAKVLASLNHPNIAAIYGIEERALVMELVEGETLAGPLPLDTALDYARQIAEALEAAHEKGIIHRDLKPANIKVTPQGVVKVLDFGLAAVAQPSRSEVTLTISPTQVGMILGTAAYMSPEQARGKAVDKRADIWAFGVVLYEMLTGAQLFGGETVSDTLAAVLKNDSDWSRVPVKVRRLLQSCLQKDPRQRLQAIGDWRLVLEGVEPLAQRRFPWPAIAAALTIALARALWAPWRTSRTSDHAPQPVLKLPVDLGSDVVLGSLYGADVVLSPDGSRIVYCSRSRLFTRRLDQSNATELAGTEGGFSPFFSPDGKWIGFFTPTELKRVSLQGGRAVKLCDFPYGKGGSWVDDYIVAGKLSSGLYRVPSAGGTPSALTELAPGEIHHRWSQVLPGGKAVLFTAYRTGGGTGAASVEVISLGDRRRKTVQPGGTFGRYLPSGHLVYLDHGTLFAARFDLDRLEIRGTPEPVLEEVAYNSQFGSAQFDFSQNGTIAYRSSVAGGGGVTVQRLEGDNVRPLLAKEGEYTYPRLAPDGERLALISAGTVEVWDWRRGSMISLSSAGHHRAPVWSPDGRYLVFSGSEGILRTRSDGAAKPEYLIRSKNLQFPTAFTRDGNRLAFNEMSPEMGQYRTWTVPIESDSTGRRAGTPELYLRSPLTGQDAVFSRDDRWVAYDSAESGTYEVQVRSFPDTGGRWTISTGGGVLPVWSPNRDELFFRNMDNQIMVAPYRVKGDSFIPEPPRLWSQKRLADLGFIRTFDVAPDGKRVVALIPVETHEGRKAQSHVIFLLNFFDYLRQRVPVGGK
jgi:serine/threonine-protein kinase